MMRMKPETLFLESNLVNLAKAREFVSRKARESGASSTEVTQIEISCDEWSANIIEHGLGNHTGKGFTIGCRLEDRKFVVTYEHEGKKFNPLDQEVVKVDEHFSEMKERGLGIYIMREMMDEIHYEYVDGKINRLSLVKYLGKEKT